MTSFLVLSFVADTITGIQASLLCFVGTAPELEVGVHPLFLKIGFHLFFSCSSLVCVLEAAT